MSGLGIEEKLLVSEIADTLWRKNRFKIAEAKAIRATTPRRDAPLAARAALRSHAAGHLERSAESVLFPEAIIDKMLMEEIVPWVPRTYTNQTDIVGPNVVNYSYDEFGYMAALDHLAVAPA